MSSESRGEGRGRAGAASISVLVVDDVALLRERITELIEADERLELAGEASEGHEALELICARKPEVVVLDVFMPRMAGDEVLYRLRRRKRREQPGVKVLVLTGGPSAELHDAILQQPDSMLYKTAVEDATICDEIVSVARGEENSPGKQLLRTATVLAVTRARLSDGELQALRRTAEGQRALAIALEQKVSEGLVRKQLSSARQKLGAATTSEAVARAYEIGLFPRPR